MELKSSFPSFRAALLARAIFAASANVVHAAVSADAAGAASVPHGAGVPDAASAAEAGDVSMVSNSAVTQYPGFMPFGFNGGLRLLNFRWRMPWLI
jgi:hypothetical protein